MKRRFEQYKNQKYAASIPSIQRQLDSRVDGDTTIITMYGVIGSFDDEITAKEVSSLLSEVDTPNITVRINSPGGESDQGISIYNLLKDHTAKVKVIVDGWALSAGGLIAMAADELVMQTGSLFMIHQSHTVAFGNKQQMMKTAEVMDKLDQAQVDIFMTKAKIEREEVQALLENETWFTASEVVTIGFASDVQNVQEPVKVSAEEYKTSILSRFQKQESKVLQQPLSASASTSTNMLDKFKRS